ncbi:3106_t:CDS:2 [Ambispora leptoticha]|uniref:3106_t:CDS:1 n=1 Tax=Ambispora leptoticha TaxID=144679 RepID=A0A9N8W9I0_9GLOM|nr:3106_t:CDS:2 [Ambispora leptoticha]
MANVHGQYIVPGPEPIEPDRYNNNRESFITNGTEILSYTGTELSHDNNQQGDGNDENEAAADQTIEPTEKKPLYRQRRFWYICCGINAVITIILILLIVFVIFPAIAQKSIDKSKLSFERVSIQMPISENSFNLARSGRVSNGGSIKATVSFPQPIDVIWNQKKIGELQLPETKISGGDSEIVSTGPFNITDVKAFSQFTIEQLNSDLFNWTLNGKVDVKALGLSARGLNFNKTIVTPGGRGFKNSTILHYQFITYNDIPLGGQNITVSMWNPSPISVYLGTLGLHIYYRETYMGLIETTKLTINPGENTINFVGSFVSNFSANDTGNLVDLFTRIAFEQVVVNNAKGAYAKPDGVHEISWLSTGVQAIEMTNVLPNVTLPPLFSLFNISFPPLSDSN